MAVEPDDGGANPNGAKTRLGGFELVRKLGQGAVGVVFLARQTSMDRAVALKVLPKRLARDQGFVERFLREARAAAKLNHPNIVQAIDAGKSGGYFYFAMEYVDGEPLQEILARTGALPEQWALEIARDVANGLDHAHQAGVLHRDVKPANIMIGPDRRAKLTDLGLARELQQQHDAAITQAGAALGTPHYISPEQVRGERDLDGRTDVYSLGATLYHMLTGSTPFSGGTSAEVMAHHLTQPVPSPKKANPRISYRAAEIVRRAMAKDPDSRHPTAAALRDDIEDLLAARAGAGPAWAEHEADAEATAPDEAPPPAGAEPKRWRMLSLVGGAALVALLVVLLVGGLLRPRPDDTPGEQTPPGVEISGTEPADPEPRPEQKKPAPEPPKPSPELAPLRAEIGTLVRQAAFGQALTRLEAFARSHPDADPAAQEALQAGVVEAAAKRYRRTVDQADDAARRRDYARARTLLQSIESFGLDEYTGRAEKKLAALAAERKQWSAWERARVDAQKLTEAGKYDAARERLGRARRLPLHGIAGLVDAELEAVARARGRAVRQARAAYAERSKTFWALLGQRKYAKADDLLAGARTDVTEPSVKPYLRADTDAASHIKTFWSRVEEGIKQRRGQFLSVAGARGKVVEVADGQVTIEAGGETKTRPVHQLTVEQALAYAKRAEAVPPLATGTFLLAERASLDEAEQAFADAPAGPSLEIYREKLARLRAPDAAADKAWKEIEEVAGGALSAAKARRLTGLLTAFEKEYEGTKRLAERTDRIAALRARANKAGAEKDGPGWSSLFNGEDLDGWDVERKHGDHWSVDKGKIRFRGRLSGRLPDAAVLTKAADLGESFVLEVRFVSRFARTVSLGCRNQREREVHAVPHAHRHGGLVEPAVLPESVAWVEGGGSCCPECHGKGKIGAWKTIGTGRMSYRKQVWKTCRRCHGTGVVEAPSGYWPRGRSTEMPVLPLKAGQEYYWQLVCVNGLPAVRVYGDRVACLVGGLSWRKWDEQTTVVLRLEGGSRAADLGVKPDHARRLENVATHALFWDVKYRTLSEAAAREVYLELIREKKWPKGQRRQAHVRWQNRFRE